MKQLIALAAVLLGASGAAHSQTTQAQARSYLLSAFVTGAAPTILSSDVGLSLGLRERLGLPPNASRDAIYEALFARTEGKSIRVRAAARDEAPLVATRAGAHPLFAVEAGETSFVVAYDVRDLLAFPPTVHVNGLSPLHPYHRLARVVQRRSYIDALAKGKERPRRRRTS